MFAKRILFLINLLMIFIVFTHGKDVEIKASTDVSPRASGSSSSTSRPTRLTTPTYPTCYVCANCPLPFTANSLYVTTALSPNRWCTKMSVSEDPQARATRGIDTGFCSILGNRCSWQTIQGQRTYLCCCNRSYFFEMKVAVEQYSFPYVSIVPRILPNQNATIKKFPMIEEGYQYIDHGVQSPYRSPVGTQNPTNNFHPLSTRTQLLSHDVNSNDNSFSNQSSTSTILETSFKTRQKNRIHHEALKDNSGDGDFILTNYPYNEQRRFVVNNQTQGLFQSTWVRSLIIIIIILIGLFSITALIISIYVLARISS